MFGKLSSRFLVALALLALVGACSRSADDRTAGEPSTAGVEVSDVQLGSMVDANNRVARERERFSPADTIYVSVATVGAAQSATLTARWTYEDGQLVDESTQTIRPSGPANTVFHVSKPDGWPEGDYRVEILLDGQPVDSKDFEVDPA